MTKQDFLKELEKHCTQLEKILPHMGGDPLEIKEYIKEHREEALMEYHASLALLKHTHKHLTQNN